MTPEELIRMNDLCREIQNEKNFHKFEELVREVTELMSAKESRFPERNAAPAGKGQKVLHATAVRTIKGYDSGEVVEIHLDDAMPLYSEIRVENSFTDERGNPLALRTPTRLDVKLHAPLHRFSPKSSPDSSA